MRSRRDHFVAVAASFAAADKEHISSIDHACPPRSS